MLRLMKKIFIIFGTLALSACASNGLKLSASQCAADWRSVGVADGRDGAPETKINEYRSACAASSPLAASDIAAWKAGWADGADVASSVEDPIEDEVIVEEHDHAHTHGGQTHGQKPVFRPSVFVGVGSGGVRGGVGLGVGFGLFSLGLGF